MKKVSKLVALSLIVSVLMSSTTAWGASLSSDSVKGSNDQILTDVKTVAGIGDFGAENGAALSSSFRSPSSIVVLPNGAQLVADTRNHLLRLVKDNQVTTYAGLSLKKDIKGFPEGGRYDGSTDASFFQNPAGLAIDSQGNIIVADAANHAIRKITPSGQVTTIAGNGLIGMKDAAGMEASFYNPSDVAVAANGTVYVADTLNHLIRSISPTGQVKTLNSLSGRLIEVTPGQVIQSGDFADGALASAKFNEPTGLALDSKGNLYVSDTGNQRIRYIDLQNNMVTTVAGSSLNDAKTGLYGKSDLYAAGDYADGPANKALFNSPQGIAVTDEGGLLIADSHNHSIRYLLNGQVSTIAGAANLRGGEADGGDRSAQLRNPSDVAVQQDGSILVADSGNNKIRKISLYKLPANLPKDNEVKVAYGSQLIEFNVKPEIKDGRTMVPVRAITETLGYKVTFNEAARSVQLSKDGVAIELYIDKTGIKKTVEGKDAVMKETDAAPYIKDDTTFVPVRFFAEQIGLNVQWYEAARTAILR
ncbi:stalk domain-containing protein [Paenibacillus radicis (ex Xue et al. 2023)]|uniref:Stalk domain-containing protein n=1 Tax=Paenibacillus radicis (ex Xue et al. 2023) TaxID=2972489 RepID=A0ABT1YFX0_9BACL|nr:stalk domain-containing protein [Paenibacillus radicis (ex Xue et al. 2023)]MCR8631123.1 stalk domain-containing protein [Paenibacillus radicis (ex Xue et al. 2023)]